MHRQPGLPDRDIRHRIKRLSVKEFACEFFALDGDEVKEGREEERMTVKG